MPVVDALLAANPSTPFELVRTMDLLIDLGQDDQAIALFERLKALPLDDQQCYELYEQVGGDRIFRLRTYGPLGPEVRLWAVNVLDAANRHSINADRLSAIVEATIRTEDKYERSLALTDLRRRGELGAALLIEKLVDDEYETYWPRIRQAIKLFGSFAESPLLAALESNSLKLRVEAISLAGNLQSRNAVDALLLPMWSPNSTELQRELASRSLRQMLGRVPSPSESETRLFQTTNQYLLDQRLLPDQSGKITSWRWNPDSRRFNQFTISMPSFSRMKALTYAKGLVELNPAQSDYQVIYWISRLESAKLNAGIRRPLPATTRDEIISMIPADLIQPVLTRAMELNRIPAAIAACEVMGTIGDQRYLTDVSGAHSPLVKALKFGAIRLTAAACQAIAKIDPTESFAGSSDYISAQVFLATATGQNVALVGHGKLETAQSLAALINRLGYLGQATTISRDLYKQSQDDSNVQLLVITDRLNQPTFSSLVQAIRSSSRTKFLPILLMVDGDNLLAADQLAERYDNILVSSLVENELIIARQLDNLNQNLTYRMASGPERANYSTRALSQLGAYATNRSRYPFFDILQYESVVVEALRTPMSTELAVRLLGELGTANAQTNLVDLASSQQSSIEIRRAATNAFFRAVQEHGIMLSRQQILQQYDRYNASRNSPKDSQEVLGALLDVLERKSFANRQQ